MLNEDCLATQAKVTELVQRREELETLAEQLG